MGGVLIGGVCMRDCVSRIRRIEYAKNNKQKKEERRKAQQSTHSFFFSRACCFCPDFNIDAPQKKKKVKYFHMCDFVFSDVVPPLSPPFFFLSIRRHPHVDALSLEKKKVAVLSS